MQFLRTSRRLTAFALALTGLGLAACQDSGKTTQPLLPDEPVLPPAVRQAAFVFDVDMARRSVRVTSPSGRSVSSALGSPTGANFSVTSGSGPSLSILAGDVVELTTSNFSASGVGAGGAPAGRVFVSFDVQVFNRLGSVRLIRPTFPAPPAGLATAEQVLLFPFSASTVVTSGGTGTEGDGTTIVIEQPSRGAVEAAQSGTGRDAFDGAPHNFFSDSLRSCTSNPNCFLYESFPIIQPNETTTGRRVGFYIDPTVNRFRARLLVAADLENATPQFGTISGTVSSTVLGNLAGVTVSAGAGFTALTNASGAFSIANVPVGARTVQITSTLPNGCSATSQGTTVTNGGTATVNFPVTGCILPTGTVTGQINSSLGGGLSGIGVVITPTGGSALAAVATSGAGAFSVTVPTLAAPVAGRITSFTNVPANCTAPATGAGLFTFSGLATGASAAISAITFTCTAPPITYPFTGTFQASTRAGAPTTESELLFRIDLTPNRPDNNGAGADQLSAITIEIEYDNTRLAPVTGSAGRTVDSDLDAVTYNPAVAGFPNRARLIYTSLGGAVVSGNTLLGRMRFNRIAAGPAPVTITFSQASGPAPDLTNLVPFIAVVTNPVILP